MRLRAIVAPAMKRTTSPGIAIASSATLIPCQGVLQQSAFGALNGVDKFLPFNASLYKNAGKFSENSHQRASLRISKGWSAPLDSLPPLTQNMTRWRMLPL